MTANHLEVQTLTGCPICGEPQAELVLTKADWYLPELHLWRCCRCRITYLNPRLTFASVITVENSSEVYNFSSAAAEEQITQHLIGLVNLLGGYVKSKQRRFLDIGCNRGLLLEAARRQGWQVTGVEISPVAAAHARDDYQLRVYPSLEELPAQGQFDLIVAWHVLEHTPDPLTFLQQAAAYLAPGGAITIQVPSFDYLAEYKQRNQLSNLVCTVHNFYFTLENLRTVVQRAGLRLFYIGNDADHLLLTAVCTLPDGPKSPSPMLWWQRILHGLHPNAR